MRQSKKKRDDPLIPISGQAAGTTEFSMVTVAIGIFANFVLVAVAFWAVSFWIVWR